MRSPLVRSPGRMLPAILMLAFASPAAGAIQDHGTPAVVGEAPGTRGPTNPAEIEAFLDAPVYLELFVKVRKGWREDDRAVREVIEGH